MIIHKGYKYRIYPNSKQIHQIEQNFGNARFVYNYFLDRKINLYKTDKTSLSYNKCAHELVELKTKLEWLKLSDSMSLQESLKDLDMAYQNFFKYNQGFPNFHSKHSNQSYRTRNQSNSIRIEDNKLILPKLGSIKIKLSRNIKGKILNATVSKTKTNKYFVSLCLEYEEDIKHNSGGLIGLDLGIKNFYSDSNGKKIDSPKLLNKYEKRLKHQQRKLSRMIESNISSYTSNRKPVYIKPINECKNIQKQRLIVAKLHEKIANSRLDFLHKESLRLVKENQIIAIEDLNVKGMIKNHKLAKSISEMSWAKFYTLLEYKAREYETIIIKIPRFYASSQTCSNCGYVHKEVKNLNIRKWTCPICNTKHDRDINAAINILNKALA